MLLKKSLRIKKALRPKRNVTVSYRDGEMATLETTMARGDRKLSACILDAWKNGALFDGRDEHFSFERWERAFAACGADMQSYCGAIPLDQPLPWSIISEGVTTEFLLRERDKALSGISTPDCRSGECSDCGCCVKGVGSDLRQKVTVRTSGRVAQGSDARKADGKRYCYRFVYEKGPQVRFLGHLDMMNVLLRAFLAARIPLAYSEGFHAHPLVSFGPPLSLSFTADNELFDMVTTETWTEECDGINKFLPEGLRLKRRGEIGLRHVSLNEDICAGRYCFAFAAADGVPSMDPGLLVSAVSQFLAQSEVSVIVRKDSVERTKNIRPLVYRAGPAGENGGVGFEAVLSMEPKNTCKPAELLFALFPGIPVSAWMVRRCDCLRRDRPGGSLLALSA
jgi:radical SAM-linked protein